MHVVLLLLLLLLTYLVDLVVLFLVLSGDSECSWNDQDAATHQRPSSSTDTCVKEQVSVIGHTSLS